MFLSKRTRVNNIILVKVQVIEIRSDFRVLKKPGNVVIMQRHMQRPVLSIILVRVDRLRANILMVSHINYEILFI